MQSRFITLAVLALLAPAAWGQAGKAEGGESDAAMERAKRAAAGPLKAIQQAARINRRRGEAEPVPVAAVVAASAVAPSAAAGAAPARPAEAAAVAAVLELGAGLPAETPAPVAPIAATPAPAAATALPSTAGVTQTLLDPVPVQPRVLQMVEPNIPAAVLAQGPQGAEVEAELSLLADGSVAGVTLLPPVPRAWQRYIVAALERWRYEPMAEARMHRVRLVFSAPGER